jgi:ABC-2 type transport system ATP-binding protein
MADSERDDAFVLFEGVSKSYADVLALDQVSFDVRVGEILGYIGPNGAGKTTTIRILVGLLSDFEGELYIEGRPVRAMRKQVHSILGYLPQEVGFQEWRTVDHALRTLGLLSGMQAGDLDRRIPAFLELLLMGDVRYRRIANLSGGMKQKLGLVQALLHQPRLLVLDEPLVGLDPASRLQVKMILKELSREGTTIFFSSHILSDVQDVASRIGILSQGQIKKIGTLDELTSDFASGKKIEIELARDSGRCAELEALPEVQRVEQPAVNRVLIHLQGDADVNEATHHLIVGLMERDCRIRRLNPVSLSLDELYLRYVEGGEDE